MTRTVLPARLRRETVPDTWTMRLRRLATAAARSARTPHTVQLMPVRITVVRPRRNLRSMVRTGLMDLAVVGAASAASYYLGRHPERIAGARRLVVTTRRRVTDKLSQHNGHHTTTMTAHQEPAQV